MTYNKTAQIDHYNGLSTASKPSNCKPGSTYLEYDTNDTYISPDGGTTWVVKDSKSIKKFTVTTTVSATAAYGASDVMSNTETATSALAWTFSSVAAYNGGTGQIIQAALSCKTQSASIEGKVYLFNGTPGGTKADNAVNTSPVWSDVSTGVFIGRLDFPKLTANGEAIIPESASCLPIYFTTPTSADDLYAIVTTNQAATLATASREIALSLWIKRL